MTAGPAAWPPTRPRAVFFDAAGTLVTPSPSPGAVVTRVLEAVAPEVLPLDGEALARHLDARMRAERAAGRLVHHPPEAAERFWRAAYIAFLSPPLSPARAAAAAEALFAAFIDVRSWALFPDVAPMLARLAGSGLTLGVLSNWEAWLPDLLAALGVGAAFAHVLVSGTLGLEKPDPAIFHLAARRAACRLDELVYVGDSLHHDIEPCVRLGIPAVLIDRGGRQVAMPGVVCLRDLGDLPAALGLRHSNSDV
jgi:putative hydrolase of the HAD superfamily